MHADMSLLPQRFIYAFGGAGLFLFLTAISGLYGACYSNRHCLNFYSTMIVVMLLAQCALLVGYFADQSWKKKLPHDDTGEAAKVKFNARFAIIGPAHASDFSACILKGSFAHSAVNHAVTDCTTLHIFLR